MTAKEIIDTLDNSNDGFYRHFVSLGHCYSYLLDVRMNLFRDDTGSWAIAIEKLGDNPRAGGILLEVFYYGNCLVNLEECNNRTSNVNYLYPVNSESYLSTFDEKEFFKPQADHWIVRKDTVNVKYDSREFADAGVVLKEYNNGHIAAEEIARVVVHNNRNVFRATDAELYKSIPADLKKIMVLDEWYHKDFVLNLPPPMDETALRHTYDFNKNLTGLSGMTFEQFADTFRQQQMMNDNWNREQWDNNRPGSYETFRMIAEVLATGNTSLYHPTLAPNTHWSNWPDSGCL